MCFLVWKIENLEVVVHIFLSSIIVKNKILTGIRHFHTCMRKNQEWWRVARKRKQVHLMAAPPPGTVRKMILLLPQQQLLFLVLFFLSKIKLKRTRSFSFYSKTQKALNFDVLSLNSFDSFRVMIWGCFFLGFWDQETGFAYTLPDPTCGILFEVVSSGCSFWVCTNFYILKEKKISLVFWGWKFELSLIGIAVNDVSWNFFCFVVQFDLELLSFLLAQMGTFFFWLFIIL